MSVGIVSLPGAAYPEFELESFSFRVDEDGALSFHFETKEVKRKTARKGSDEEDEDEDENDEEAEDWQSKSAWDNYGPVVNADYDFGSLKPLQPLDLSGKLPVTATFDPEASSGVHCCDHQEALKNKIVFSARKGDCFALTWTGFIRMDEDDGKLYPFAICVKQARLEAE